MLIHLEKLGKTFGEKVVLHDVTASVEREDRIGIVGQNGAGKTTLLKILTGEYQDYEGEFSVTHGGTLGYLEQNAKLDATLDIYGEMRATFAPVLDAMAQMQILERRMAAQPDNADLLAQHDALQNIVDAADGYNMDVNIKKVLSGMGFAQDTWQKNIAVLSGGELTRLRLAKLLLEKPDVLILDEPTNHLDFATMEWLENYLKGYSGAVLVVSHDRYFLDNVCTKIWEVSFQTMTTYKGNFSAYLPQKEAADALRQKQHDADVALAEKLHYHGDLEAAKTLILSHLRFVVHIARNYAGYGLPQADLIQEGNIGLMKAVRRFNPEVGVRLVSFAVHWIKAEIHEYVLRNWRIVKVATTKAQRKLFFNLRKTKQRLGWFNQDEVEMVARELGVTSKDVREMESRMAAQDMTFDLSSDDDSDSQPMAPVLYLQDKSSNFADGIEDDNWEEQAANRLTDAMQGLDERSQDIIRARWLDEDNKSTLQELADRYGVSAERVRQLEKNAMKKLRAAIEA